MSAHSVKYIITVTGFIGLLLAVITLARQQFPFLFEIVEHSSSSSSSNGRVLRRQNVKNYGTVTVKKEDELSSTAIESMLQAKSLVKSIGKSIKNPPPIVLMMGFPYSGQDFLQRAVHDMTYQSTAINYGEAVMLPNGIIVNDAMSSVPIYEEDPSGPFAFSSTHPLPTTGHILTRTYCSGYCSNCMPQYYIIKSKRTFHYECTIGTYFNQGRVQKTFYSPDRINKYVHLIRDPKSNVAARFVHEYNVWKVRHRLDMLEKYTYNKDGFQKWCKDFDDNNSGGRRFDIERKFYITNPVMETLARKVPCHSNFFQIVQWHNYAFEVSQSKELIQHKPTKIIYFDDIIRKPNVVMNDLIKYLELEKKSEIIANFKELGFADEFYTPEQIGHIEKWTKSLSSDVTWSHLSRFFKK